MAPAARRGDRGPGGQLGAVGEEEATKLFAQDFSRPAVYVIDGDASVRESLRVLLGTLCIDVRLFCSAEEFLSVPYEALNACLVTEIDLPGMSGLELQEHLQERGVSLPVIILASRGDVQLAVRAMRSGAVDFLEKPLVERALLTRVRQALDLETRPL